MMPYITAFFMPRTKGRPPGCHSGWLCQLCIPRTVYRDAERYRIYNRVFRAYRNGSGLRTARCDRGVPEVWGSVYDVRELLDSSVKLMDGKSPLQMNLGPLNVIKKPLLGKIKGTVIEKLLRDHDVLRDGMI